ncbi:potassium channel subfamily K member 6 [Engraulis encrasicolus]|uniref:potassium channel subfamily K member 6 n=1 Tax=Engraulis encrasicolus TaxID=184585 RepID=UPI002FD7874D
MSPIIRTCFLLAGFVFFYIAYLLLGALVFSYIEGPVEEKLRTDLTALKEQFLNQTCINVTQLDAFLDGILKANKYGVSVLRNASGLSNWDLASSLFFANTLVTTVGYGHTTPLSDAGKAFSIVYALVGVPFTMLVLAACVHRLMYPLTYWPLGVLQQRAGLQPRVASLVHFVVLLMLVVLCFFAIPALVFTAMEDNWSFLDAFYFCFISLCTIGLGDFVPGEQPGQNFRGLYKISVMVYLFVGLMVMFLVLRTFHKLADLYGLTAFFHLPTCDEDLAEDKEPIVGAEEAPESDKAMTSPLDPSSHATYNTINATR